MDKKNSNLEKNINKDKLTEIIHKIKNNNELLDIVYGLIKGISGDK